jgi:phenylacetate-CoA ligase
MTKAATDLLAISEHELLDDVDAVRNKKNNLMRDIKEVVGISVKVTLVPPGTIPRSEGKAKRIEDRRPK